MSCAYCRKRIWFWQSSVYDIAGREHRRCWRDRWHFIMEAGYFRHLSDALQAEALLTMPEEYVEEASRTYGLGLLDAQVVDYSLPPEQWPK